jgi:hypothetical protein
MDLARTTLEKYQEGAKGDLEMRQKAILQMVEPIKESLQKVDEQIRAIEKDRNTAYGGLTEQLKKSGGYAKTSCSPRLLIWLKPCVLLMCGAVGERSS